MASVIQQLQKEELIKLDNAAVVIGKQGSKPNVKQAQNLAGAGALGGAFWGMLIGLLFFMPWLGLAVGAAPGAVAGHFSYIGIDDKFIKQVSDTIEPGHSPLFLMVADLTPDKVLDSLEKYDATVLRTSLSEEDEAKLREAFAHEEDEN